MVQQVKMPLFISQGHLHNYFCMCEQPNATLAMGLRRHCTKMCVFKQYEISSLSQDQLLIFQQHVILISTTCLEGF